MRRDGSIRVSEKHGVNPTLGVCFWCGGDDGTIGLLGRLPGDAEAPRKMVLTYEPCEKCKGNFALGFALIECDTSPVQPGQPAIQRDPRELYPTGRYCVLKREAAQRIFGEELTRGTKAFCEPGVIDRLEADQAKASASETVR